MRKKYFTEEERKAAHRDNALRHYNNHKEMVLEKHKEWLQTPNGRASGLLNAYNHKDIAQGREKGDLTVQWIVENIFSKPCAHCGKTGWQVIGCNRLDNSKPHTKDNVEPCCFDCNNKLNYVELAKRVDQIDKVTGEVLRQWDRAMDVERELGYNHSAISQCCNGKKQTAYGYIWKYALE